MSDFSVSENLVYMARNGDKAAMDALIAALAPTVESIASAYGGKYPLTRSDLIQEGMIGLLSSVYGYSGDGQAEFKTYAATCIANRIRSAVRNQFRNKQLLLYGYVQIDEVDVSDSRSDPQSVIAMQEKMSDLYRRIENELSPLERNVLRLHIAGQNYGSIAEQLSVSEKSVDNALQRARKKLQED